MDILYVLHILVVVVLIMYLVKLDIQVEVDKGILMQEVILRLLAILVVVHSPVVDININRAMEDNQDIMVGISHPWHHLRQEHQR